jgi:hypothetical protein
MTVNGLVYVNAIDKDMEKFRANSRKEAVCCHEQIMHFLRYYTDEFYGVFDQYYLNDRYLICSASIWQGMDEYFHYCCSEEKFKLEPEFEQLNCEICWTEILTFEGYVSIDFYELQEALKREIGRLAIWFANEKLKAEIQDLKHIYSDVFCC